MKRFSVFGVLAVLGMCLLIFLTVKTVELDKQIAQIARPSKLFTPANIISDFSYNPKWQVKISPSHDRFFYVLSQQPLYWIGKGMQVVVFETADKKYVVKFFQLAHIKANSKRSWFRRLFSSESKEQKKQRKERKEELYASSKMCFEELPEETGFVYVHLNRTTDQIKGVKLIDKCGQSHRIRGDDACFVVQQKASYIIPTFVKLMESGEFEKACQRVDHIFDLLLAVARKGFTDSDDALIRNNNIGFSEGRAIYIDTGHLARAKESDLYKRMSYEFDVRLEPLQKWLDVMYPSLAKCYAERRAQILEQLKNESTSKS